MILPHPVSARMAPAQLPAPVPFVSVTPAGAPTGLFSGMEHTSASGASKFFTPGEYVVRLGTWIYKDVTQSAVIPTTVLRSTYDPTYAPNCCQVGSTPTVFFTDNYYYHKNIANLICAATPPYKGEQRPPLGYVDKPEIAVMFSEAQLCARVVVGVHAYDVRGYTRLEFYYHDQHMGDVA